MKRLLHHQNADINFFYNHFFWSIFRTDPVTHMLENSSTFFLSEKKFWFTCQSERDFFSNYPTLRIVVVGLVILQMLFSGLAATDGVIQQAAEFTLLSILVVSVLSTPILRWESILISFLLITGILSFFYSDFWIAAVNFKQNSLAVFSIIAFPRMQYKSKLVLAIFIITILMIFKGRYFFELSVPLASISSQPEFNLSRFGGLFLNAHFNALFVAMVFISLGKRPIFQLFGLFILYLSASKFILIAYFCQLLWMFIFKKYLNYIHYAFSITCMITCAFLFQAHLPNLINQATFNSLYIILYQLGNAEYYAYLLNLIPRAMFLIPPDESFNIANMVAEGKLCIREGNYFDNYSWGDGRAACTILFPHDGHNEIGYFSLAVQSGLPLGALMLAALLKHASAFRVILTVVLFHNAFIFTPLIIYLATNYGQKK